jgi:hypothetical protein
LEAKLFVTWVKKFGPNRGDVIGDWRRLNNEELNDLNSLANIIW